MNGKPLSIDKAVDRYLEKQLIHILSMRVKGYQGQSGMWVQSIMILLNGRASLRDCDLLQLSILFHIYACSYTLPMGWQRLNLNFDFDSWFFDKEMKIGSSFKLKKFKTFSLIVFLLAELSNTTWRMPEWFLHLFCSSGDFIAHSILLINSLH